MSNKLVRQLVQEIRTEASQDELLRNIRWTVRVRERSFSNRIGGLRKWGGKMVKGKVVFGQSVRFTDGSAGMAFV